jgi:hypothetical protein
MILTHLYKLIQFAISLIMPSHKPRKEWTIDDVKAALADKAKAVGEPLDWHTSHRRSLQAARSQSELRAAPDMYVKAGGAGAYAGSAEQNIWLHQQLMENLAKHGFGDYARPFSLPQPSRLHLRRRRRQLRDRPALSRPIRS